MKSRIVEFNKCTAGPIVCFGSDAIKMGGRKFTPIEVLEAAQSWWRLARERGWELKDSVGVRIRTDKTVMRVC